MDFCLTYCVQDRTSTFLPFKLSIRIACEEITDRFRRRTGTSVDDGERIKNIHIRVFFMQSSADVPVLLLISLITKRRHTELMVHIDLKGQVRFEPRPIGLMKSLFGRAFYSRGVQIRHCVHCCTMFLSNA